MSRIQLMKWTDKNLMNIHRFKMQSDKYKFTASPTITTIIQIIKKKNQMISIMILNMILVVIKITKKEKKRFKFLAVYILPGILNCWNET